MSWNNPFKALATEKYNQWLAEQGINQLTSGGNYCTMVNWILEAWEEISWKTIKKSFKSCALNLVTDRSEGNLNRFFKERVNCKVGK